MSAITNDPIPYKESLDFVNSFFVNTLTFLNKISSEWNERLYSISERIGHLEKTLYILEKKLQSVEGLEKQAETLGDDMPAPPPPDGIEEMPGPPPGDGDPMMPPPPPPPPMSEAGGEMPTPLPPADLLPMSPSVMPQAQQQFATPDEMESPTIYMCKDDPRLKQYFKLLKIGARKVEVMKKFANENPGLDPRIIEMDPNELSPLGPLMEGVSSSSGDEGSSESEMSEDEGPPGEPMMPPPPPDITMIPVFPSAGKKKKKKKSKNDDDDESEEESGESDESDEEEGETDDEEEGESDEEEGESGSEEDDGESESEEEEDDGGGGGVSSGIDFFADDEDDDPF